MKKPKYQLKQTVKDIGMFSVGSMMLGASASAVAPFGGHSASGLAGMGSMMPTLGTTVMLKNQVGLLSSTMDYLPKQRKVRRI